MGRLRNYLENGHILLLDGALGTEIEHRGYDVSTKLWSASYLIKEPKIIYDIHLDYLKAGADILTTSSYQASIEGLTEELNISENEAKQIIASTVTIAKKARDDFWKELDEDDRKDRLFPLIGGDIGPFAAYLADGSEYTGLYPNSKIDIKDFHRNRIAILLENGVDFLIIETIPNYKELLTIIELLKEEFSDVDAYLSVTLKNEHVLADGTPYSDLVKIINQSQQILAFGANCCSPNFISPTLKKLKPLTHKPFVVYPNSGEIYDGKDKIWLHSENEENNLLEKSKEWLALGTQIIGGCCRTRPSDIKNLKQLISN